MRVLVIGGGGREHALAWKLAQSPRVDVVYAAPGNAGTAREPRVENVAVDVQETDALLEVASQRRVDLTVVGPEGPLVAGIVDRFQAAGLPCFGPRRGAAALEGSKDFTKAFLARHHIPSAPYRSFTDARAAERYLRGQGAPIVVKADGLAAGKGVVIARSRDEAVAAARAMLSGDAFGEAGRRVVIESFLEGEEASFIALVDGQRVLPLATSQDHKARDEGDRGPNTGGMGAYSPAPVIDSELHQRVLERIMVPTVQGLAAEGIPFTGFLYAGLMIGADGMPRVLEFNCRCGDPETQPMMLRLRSDLVDLIEAALAGELGRASAQWDPRAALGVVLAAGGYPGAYRTGDVISGLDEEFADTKVFHAGTREEGGKVVTAGGRVLCVCGLGEGVQAARDAAYARVAEIDWAHVHYRRDIGYRAVARERR